MSKLLGLLLVAVSSLSAGYLTLVHSKTKICDNMASILLPVDQGLVTYSCTMSGLDTILEIESLLLPRTVKINLDTKEELK